VDDALSARDLLISRRCRMAVAWINDKPEEGWDSSICDSCDPQQNHLLAALTATERGRLYPYLKLVAMSPGEVVAEPGTVQRYVYFPIDCVISYSHVMKDGASAQITVIGNEGFVGSAVLDGAESNPIRVTVQCAGSAYLLEAKRLKEEFDQGAALRAPFLRYTRMMVSQIAQTAACNLHHTAEQRMCRWLLAYLDRVPSNQLAMTQEVIASMLGVRREGVSLAASKLQRLGAISYARGHITVLDRSKLERECCECYSSAFR
jgi:CRP-like cAMP-binding protein